MVVRSSALCASCPLTAIRFLVLISVKGWVHPKAIVQLEGLGQLINPMTSSGIEHVTFPTVHSYQGQFNGDLSMKIFVRSKLLIYWCRFKLYFHSSTSIKNSVYHICSNGNIHWHHTFDFHLLLGSQEHETLRFNLYGRNSILKEWWRSLDLNLKGYLLKISLILGTIY
jgi:hypothetical protein